MYLQIRSNSPFAEGRHDEKLLICPARSLIGVGEADTGFLKYISWQVTLSLETKLFEVSNLIAELAEQTVTVTLLCQSGQEIPRDQVTFPCSVVLLFLRSTRNHWVAVSEVRQKTSTGRSSVPSKVSHNTQISCCNHRPLLKSSYPFLPHRWPLLPWEDPQSCNRECDWFAYLLNSWWQLAWIEHTWHICSTLFRSYDSFQFCSQRRNLAVFAWQRSNISCLGHACTTLGACWIYGGLDS